MALKKNDGIDVLRAVWLFERCTKRELESLQRITESVEVPAGTVLTTQGAIGREFFVIVRGEVEATRSGVSIGVLGAGSFFGEMALLDRLPRTATVTTRVPTVVLVITAQAFTGLVDTMPSVDRKMLIVLAERLRAIEARYVPVEARVTNPDIS